MGSKVTRQYRPKRQRKAASWLAQATGRSDIAWVAWVQEAIRRASRPSKDPRHDMTNANKWLEDLTRLVVQEVRKTPGYFDGNVQSAAIVAHVLLLWTLRVWRAKAFDPRRPFVRRQASYRAWRKFCLSLNQAMLDEEFDPTHFPEQEWENPFLSDATDGTYV